MEYVQIFHNFLKSILDIPQQFGRSQDRFVLPFEPFQLIKHCQVWIGTTCWIFYFNVFQQVHLFPLQCNIKFGFEATKLSVFLIALHESQA